MHFPDSFPVPLIVLDETDSTNRYLNECGQVAELTTVVSRYQTAGRGQRGNSWESEAGQNLLFSFVLYPTFLEARHQFLISQFVSLSLKEVLDEFTEGITIKWPNDIYWQEKKIAGILIEHDVQGPYLCRSLAGIGVNINQEVFRSPAPNPVSLRQIIGKETSLPDFLYRVMQRMQSYYNLLRDGHHAEIATKYQNALFHRTGFHTYRDAGGVFEAEIVHVHSSGLLVLRDRQGVERKYAFKEVEYLLI